MVYVLIALALLALAYVLEGRAWLKTKPLLKPSSIFHARVIELKERDEEISTELQKQMKTGNTVNNTNNMPNSTSNVWVNVQINKAATGTTNTGSIASFTFQR